MKRAWNLAPVLQIIQNFSEKYCNCLYLPIDQGWLVNELLFKTYIQKMHPTSGTNTHHDVTDLVNHRMVKYIKSWIIREQNTTFLWNKKILNLCLRWYILRSYRFIAEVTFNLYNIPSSSFLLVVKSISFDRFSISCRVPFPWTIIWGSSC